MRPDLNAKPQAGYPCPECAERFDSIDAMSPHVLGHADDRKPVRWPIQWRPVTRPTAPSYRPAVPEIPFMPHFIDPLERAESAA